MELDLLVKKSIERTFLKFPVQKHTLLKTLKPFLRHKPLKTIPYSAAHARLGQIRDCSPSPFNRKYRLKQPIHRRVTTLVNYSRTSQGRSQPMGM